MEFFDWYFVACALSIRTDKMILFNALRRHDGDHIVPMDATLCIIQGKKKNNNQLDAHYGPVIRDNNQSDVRFFY